MLPYEISPSEAAQLLRANGAKLVDVREPWEFTAAHIEGSLHLPMGQLATRAHKELAFDDRLIVVCHIGGRSRNATAWLRRQGFEKAQSLAGGIDAWSVVVDPKGPRY